MPSLTCPHCDGQLRTKTEIPAGKRIKCPQCHKAFVFEGNDDFDESPPRIRPSKTAKSKKAKASKSSPGLSVGLMAGIAVAALVLVGGAIVGVLVLTGSRKAPSTGVAQASSGSEPGTIATPSAARNGETPANNAAFSASPGGQDTSGIDFAYLPDIDSVQVVRVAQVMSSPYMQRIFESRAASDAKILPDAPKKMREFEERYGLSLADVESITIGWFSEYPDGAINACNVSVARFSKEIDPQRIIGQVQNAPEKKTTSSGVEYWYLVGFDLWFPDQRTAVLTGSGYNMIDKIIAAKPGVASPTKLPPITPGWHIVRAAFGPTGLKRHAVEFTHPSVGLGFLGLPDTNVRVPQPRSAPLPRRWLPAQSLARRLREQRSLSFPMPKR